MFLIFYFEQFHHEVTMYDFSKIFTIWEWVRFIEFVNLFFINFGKFSSFIFSNIATDSFLLSYSLESLIFNYTFLNLLISFKSLTFSLFHIFQKKYPLSVSILLCMFSLVLFNLLILYSASSDLFNWLISLFTAA